MNIGVLGTGIVGRMLSARFSELGHLVVVGTRDPDGTLSRKGSDQSGNPPFGDWLGDHPDVGLGRFTEAARHGEIVVNAVNGSGALAALNLAGNGNLEGKILVDVSNPLDFSKGMPPSLSVSNTDSLGERIQREYPGCSVVKTLNTVSARVMVYPENLGAGDHSVFLSGNDGDAKNTVRALLIAFGWKDIIDLGDITTSRGVEMYLPLWLRLWGALGSGIINIRVVR